MYFYKDIYYPKTGVENSKDAGIHSVTSKGVDTNKALEYKKYLEDMHELSKKFIEFNLNFLTLLQSQNSSMKELLKKSTGAQDTATLMEKKYRYINKQCMKHNY